eukprot:gb/GECG01009959.1/.p1 GENE.gb/GECG01009959.1/~~gb/GECG01009959.1/.p1  ORF type:complete len:687 (+),score=82.35 gb/GECG01009959.1/:1-2061(+)
MSTLAESFKRELSELGRHPDGSVIHALTMVANDASNDSIGVMSILQVIEEQLKKVPPDCKLPVVYALDSILKRVGGLYIKQLGPRVEKLFQQVIPQIPRSPSRPGDISPLQKVRKCLYTWTEFKILTQEATAIINEIDRLDARGNQSILGQRNPQMKRPGPPMEYPGSKQNRYESVPSPPPPPAPEFNQPWNSAYPPAYGNSAYPPTYGNSAFPGNGMAQSMGWPSADPNFVPPQAMNGWGPEQNFQMPPASMGGPAQYGNPSGVWSQQHMYAAGYEMGAGQQSMGFPADPVQQGVPPQFWNQYGTYPTMAQPQFSQGMPQGYPSSSMAFASSEMNLPADSGQGIEPLEIAKNALWNYNQTKPDDETDDGAVTRELSANNFTDLANQVAMYFARKRRMESSNPHDAAAAASEPVPQLTSEAQNIIHEIDKSRRGGYRQHGTNQEQSPSEMVEQAYAYTGPSPLDTSMDDFTIKKRDDGAIAVLYDTGLPYRCMSDGLRFSTQKELKAHQAWISSVREKKKPNSGIISQPWFPQESDWISSVPRQLEVEDKSFFDFQEEAQDEGPDPQASEDMDHVVSADEDQPYCALSGEKFRKVWDNRRDKWVYVGAVKQQDGTLCSVHALPGSPANRNGGSQIEMGKHVGGSSAISPLAPEYGGAEIDYSSGGEDEGEHPNSPGSVHSDMSGTL